MTGRLATSFAEHQLQPRSTSRVATGSSRWFVGGLNFQVEHHLFPRICHVHYPKLPLVEQTCRDCGLPYRSHPSLRSGLVSHFRWLRRMGQAPAAAAGR